MRFREVIKSHCISVTSDDIKKNYGKYNGEKDLYDFACEKMTEFFRGFDQASHVNIINIESYKDSYEEKPKLSNSSTWYTVHYVNLRVFYTCLEMEEEL